MFDISITLTGLLFICLLFTFGGVEYLTLKKKARPCVRHKKIFCAWIRTNC